MAEARYEKVKPSHLTKRSVFNLAESIGTQLGYKPGCDLIPIVAKLGGKIEYRDFWDPEFSDSGSIEIDSEGDFTIYLSMDTSIARDRFTIAHELGHYILHFIWPIKKKNMELGNIMATRYGSDRVEWEANWFAAAFLMPKKQFVDVFKKSNQNLTVVADHFGVSTMAAKIRAQSLDLIPQNEDEF